jgi:hypothetical protein
LPKQERVGLRGLNEDLVFATAEIWIIELLEIWHSRHLQNKQENEVDGVKLISSSQEICRRN